MSGDLYTRDLLRLAVESARYPLLDAPDARVERRSPLCGSRITLDLAFDGDARVRAVGMAANACAVGQASAALLAGAVIGQDAEAVTRTLDDMNAWLAGTRDAPPDWPGIEAIAAARATPGRHGAMRLPFEAARAAFAAWREEAA